MNKNMFFKSHTQRSPTLDKLLNDEEFFINYVYNKGGLGPVLKKLNVDEAMTLTDHVLATENLFNTYLNTPAHISAVFYGLDKAIQTKMLTTVLNDEHLRSLIVQDEQDYQHLLRNFPDHLHLIKDLCNQQPSEHSLTTTC